MRSSIIHCRGVVLSTVLLALWSLLPSCRGRLDQESSLKTETDNIKNLTIPDGAYPANDPDKPISPFGATVAWEFDTAMCPEAYIRWVVPRLEPAFTPRANSQAPFLFYRYRDGDEEVIQIDTTSRAGKLHVLVTLDLYSD